MLLNDQVRGGLRIGFRGLRVFVDLDESNFGGMWSGKNLRRVSTRELQREKLGAGKQVTPLKIFAAKRSKEIKLENLVK